MLIVVTLNRVPHSAWIHPEGQAGGITGSTAVTAERATSKSTPGHHNLLTPNKVCECCLISPPVIHSDLIIVLEMLQTILLR